MDHGLIPLENTNHTSEFANIRRMIQRIREDLDNGQEQTNFMRTPALITIVARGIHYYHRLRRLYLPKHENQVVNMIVETTNVVNEGLSALHIISGSEEGAYGFDKDVIDAKDKESTGSRNRASTPLSARTNTDTIMPVVFDPLEPIPEYTIPLERMNMAEVPTTHQFTNTGTIPRTTPVTSTQTTTASSLNTIMSTSARTIKANIPSTASTGLFSHYIPIEPSTGLNNGSQEINALRADLAQARRLNDSQMSMYREELVKQREQFSKQVNDLRRELTNREIDRSINNGFQNHNETTTGRNSTKHWAPDTEGLRTTPYGSTRTTVYRELGQWKVMFSGDGTNQSFEEYSQSVYDFAASQGISDNQVVRSIAPTLKGMARIWYMGLDKEGLTLDRFFELLREQFIPYSSEIDTIAEMTKTKYEVNLGIFEHVQAMYAKIALTHFTWSERTKVDIILKTLPVEMRTACVTRGIRNTMELTQFCRELDTIYPKKATEKAPPGVYKPKRVSEINNQEENGNIDPLEEYDGAFKAEVIQARRAFNRTNATPSNKEYPLAGCYNCFSKEHRHASCPKPQTHVFCYRCGRPNTTMKDCETEKCVARRSTEMSEAQKN